jgi:hypothetical protein
MDVLKVIGEVLLVVLAFAFAAAVLVGTGGTRLLTVMQRLRGQWDASGPALVCSTGPTTSAKPRSPGP